MADIAAAVIEHPSEYAKSLARSIIDAASGDPKRTNEAASLIDLAMLRSFERAVQWHLMQTKVCRQQAYQWPEEDENRRDFLAQAIWHFDCIAALRALPKRDKID